VASRAIGFSFRRIPLSPDLVATRKRRQSRSPAEMQQDPCVQAPAPGTSSLPKSMLRYFFRFLRTRARMFEFRVAAPHLRPTVRGLLLGHGLRRRDLGDRRFGQLSNHRRADRKGSNGSHKAVCCPRTAEVRVGDKASKPLSVRYNQRSPQHEARLSRDSHLFVGIFWAVQEKGSAPGLLHHRCPISEAEPYGDMLTYSHGHYEIWEQWRTNPASPWSAHDH
jgi:hypothetical protein